MELDSYGIHTYFTGNMRDISIDDIQLVSISDKSIKTDHGVFTFQTKLGSGTYGTSYSTLPDTDGISYAIKIIDLRNSDELYDVLAEVLMNIILFEGTRYESQGPYVPELYEFGISVDRKTAIIRTERMSGTLFDYLNKHSVHMNDTLVPSILIQLINMMELLQTNFQFNHRDLKSDNIMYSMKKNKPQWRIIDFGAACMKWNDYTISADAVFNSSRPCVHPGRDITFLITEIVLDVRLSPKLKALLRNLVTFSIYGKECALNSTNCNHIGYKQWTNIYNILNKSNVMNPHYKFIKKQLNTYLQKLKPSLWNTTFRIKTKHAETRRNRGYTRRQRRN
jgi:serine/threonine protein kinase